MHKIPLAKPYFDEKEIEQVKETFKSGWVAGQGPKSTQLSKKICEYLGVKHCIPVINCTAGLHLSLLALGIGKGDEVIVSDFTFPATGHAVLYTGATPRFADISLDTYNIDPAKIEQLINEKTKAIIVVHAFGQPCNMEEIMKIAKKHDIKVIEDAACALGAEYAGKKVGTFADISAFSFHARKNATTGEGGAVVTNNDAYAEKIRLLSCFGMTSAWTREQQQKAAIPLFVELGYNYKLSDINCAIGLAQIDKLDSLITKRRELVKIYNEKLGRINGITIPKEEGKHIYQSYVILLDKSINRNAIISSMAEKGIGVQFGTYASHIQPVYKSKDKCPNSLQAYEQTLALPLYYELTEEQINTVVDELKNAI